MRDTRKMPVRQHNYENLVVWKRGIKLVALVYKLAEKLPKTEVFALASQMKRAAVSIPANIAEGSRRSTNKDFFHFISIALGSAAELETHIRVAIELNFFDNSVASDALKETGEISRMLQVFGDQLKR